MQQTAFRTLTLPAPGNPAIRVVPTTKNKQRVLARVIDSIAVGLAAQLTVSVEEIQIPGQVAFPAAYAFAVFPGTGPISFVMPENAQLFAIAAGVGAPTRLALILSDAQFEDVC